jgi:lipooligosaccharide transport system permease protein
VTGTTATPSIALRITPAALIGGRRASRLVERNVLVYRRQWVFLLSGFFEPFFYLLSIGLGLNHLVGEVTVGGEAVAYTAFVAPGLLAASAMNGAMFDATFGTYFKLKIAKTYDAILSTPLDVGDVALGELAWALIRGSLYAGAFMVVMTGLGYVVSPWAILCYPGAILTSAAFAATGMVPRTCGVGRTSTSCRSPSCPSSCSRPPSTR